MATTTTNYGLVKPALTDAPPDITAINPNWDKIDEELKKAVNKDGDVMNGSLTVIDNFNVNKTFDDVEYKTYVRPINYSIGNNGDYSTGLIHYKGDANQAQLMFNKDGVMLRDNVNAKAYKLFGQHNTGDAPFLPLTGGTLSGMFGLVHKVGIMHNGVQTGSIENWGSETIVTAAENASAERHYISIGNPVAGALRANTLMLYHLKNGVYTKKAIYGEHNKPNGSYTGNNSATSRTIDVGGIGELVVIVSNTGMALVTGRGAICMNRETGAVSGLKSYEINYDYSTGKLTIATNNAFVNSSQTYWYRMV